MKLKLILSLPKTLYFNLRIFDFKTALKMPIIVSYDTKISSIHKGCISFEAPVRRGMVEIGITSLDGVSSYRKNYVRIGINGHIVFKEDAYFASGSLINVDQGNLTIGKKFIANNNFYISCNDIITIGDNVLIGWCCNILDTDNHKVTGIKRNKKQGISIGNHVWLGAYCDLLKGTVIHDNSIIGYRSMTNKDYIESHALVAGHPAKIIQTGVNWE